MENKIPKCKCQEQHLTERLVMDKAGKAHTKFHCGYLPHTQRQITGKEE